MRAIFIFSFVRVQLSFLSHFTDVAYHIQQYSYCLSYFKYTDKMYTHNCIYTFMNINFAASCI